MPDHTFAERLKKKLQPGFAAAEAFDKQQAPKALPGKAPRIKPVGPRRLPKTGAEMKRRDAVDAERKAAAARIKASQAAKPKKSAAPKAKVEPEFITLRSKGGSIKIRNPKFKKRKTK